VLLVAVGLVLTNDFNRDQYRLQQDSNEEQQELTLNGQRADRFVKAIDQLGQEGNDKLGIRLGGIYALETLMRDSNSDENTIIEVLCAFIRTHAIDPDIPFTRKAVPVSPLDVRAALTVLGRRREPDHHTRLDLSNTLLGLDRIDLKGANLHDAQLVDADLRGATLVNADLSDTTLSSADLRGADLTDADLTNAVLFQADLRGAQLTGAHLNGANLTSAYLHDADLRCTTMDRLTKLPLGVARSDPETLKSPECQQP